MMFCKDCRFFEAPTVTCGAILNMVTGEQTHMPCSDARSSPWACGEEAKLFKDREEKTVERGAKTLVDHEPHPRKRGTDTPEDAA